MEEIRYLWKFKLLLVIICRFLTVADAIRAVGLPTSLTVIEGGTAEFNCTTAEKDPNEELYWAIKWEDGSLLMWYYLPAEVNRTHTEFLRGTALIHTSSVALGQHGSYTTIHREARRGPARSNLAFSTLRIDGIHNEDQGRFYCVYRRDGSFQNLYAEGQSGGAQLTVVTPPEGDAPSCAVSQVASADPTLGGALVELSCISSIIAVNPLPTVTWITGNTELSSTSGSANLYRYTLKEKDNGRKFVCVVTHPSLTSPSTCSVMPLEEPPNAVITPEVLVAAVGSDAVFKCIGSGIPYISKYTWFIGEGPLSHSNEHGSSSTSEVSYAGSEGWSLRLTKLERSANNTIVTCEVSLPSGLSSNASAFLQLRESQPISVKISPKRVRVFKDSDITFTCSAESESKHNTFTWYFGDSAVSVNATAENQPFKIKTLGQWGSILFVSKERAWSLDNDIRVTCECALPSGNRASDSGVLVAQKNSRIQVDVTPNLIEVPWGTGTTFTCLTQPSDLQNATYVWQVHCDPTRPGDTDNEWTESGSEILTLSRLNSQCDVGCLVSLPSGLSASATGHVIVQNHDQPSLGEVLQPETRSTSLRLSGALGAGGVGIFLGVTFCSALLLVQACLKNLSRNKKTSGTVNRSHINTPIYETINPQCGNRDQISPDVPLVGIIPCQQQSNATYNRPPMGLPRMHVALPPQGQRLPSVPAHSEVVDEGPSMSSSLSKDSLNTELGMNSSPSTATFGGTSDLDEHEYERCEITTCV